ncbi:MAG: tetratricopeptide repeat protein [Desulfobacteraceae bacterium]|nr:tetratricopeptide repeat protein [Desulfobacteraceae bacterium]MBC2718938.1 tetratricopeptide repeat protein [Desulfobacteraceae bacterium]
MIKPAFKKIYIILGEHDKKNLEWVLQTLSFLYSHVNLTSNIYLVSENLPASMPQVERIQKNINKFLSEHLFARLYVHIVHPAPPSAMDDIRLCYKYLKQSTDKFDQEGYRHQELPRLILLPVLVPDDQIKPIQLIDLLDVLKNSFLLSSLYLNKDTLNLAQDEKLLSLTDKIYYGIGNSREMTDVVCNLFRQDILDDSLDKLENNDLSMTKFCPDSLIISAQDGNVYCCMDAFLKNEGMAKIYEMHSLEKLLADYYQQDKLKRDCLGCREQVLDSFVDLPKSLDTNQKIGALLYHFGMLRQDSEDDFQAIKNFKQSLNLSPIEETNPVYFRLGLGYTKIGQYDQALKAFNSVELSYQGQYFFHFYKGLCYFETGDYAVALEEFSKALQSEPQHDDQIRILIYMGTCFNNLGKYEQAVGELEKAKETAGNVKEVYNALGFSYFKLKDYDKSIENLKIAVEIDPFSAIDYASLGSNYREKGDLYMAIGMYEKALTLDPGMSSVREHLERLNEIS